MTLNATSESPRRSVTSVSALEQIETGALVTGDLAFVVENESYWRLDKESTVAESVTVKPTRNSAGGVGAGRWLFLTSGSSVAPVANVAALAALDDTNLYDGQTVFVQTFKQRFTLERTSTLTPDDVSVVDTFSGDGVWVRNLQAVEDWVEQTDWYLDYSAGNDENAGTSLAPIKTIAEWYRRTRGLFASVITTLHLVGTTWPAADPFLGYPLTAIKSGIVFMLVGTRTVSRSGTFTSAGAVPVPAANTASTATDNTVANWDTDIGKLIVVTSGATSGSFAWVLKDLTAGVARVTRWATKPSSTYVTVSAAPANGTTYDVVSMTTIQINRPTISRGAYFWVEDVALTNALETNYYNNVFVKTLFANGVSAMGSSGQAFACLFKTTNPYFEAYGTMYTSLCGSNGVTITVGAGTRLVLDWWTQQGGSLRVGGPISFVEAGGFIGFYSDCGIFSATVALDVSNLGVVQIGGSSGTLYGTSNTTVAQPRSRGNIFIRSGYTPTITGTTEISWVNGISQIPEMVPGSPSTLQNAANCNTWALWAAAPFSRRCVNFRDQAAILTN